MTDHSDLIERARAYRPYNHLNDGDLVRQLLDALSSQSLSLSEAREEIERLREALRLIVAIREGVERGNSLKVAHAALVSGSREDGE